MVTTRRKLVENVFCMYFLQGANYLLPLITLPYLMRVLGAQNFGLLIFAQAFIQYFVILTEYGFNLTATRNIAVQRNQLDKVQEIFCTTIYTKSILALVSFFIMGAIVFAVAQFRSDWPVYLAAFLTVIGNVMVPVWLFQGMEKMRDITLINVSARTVSAVLIFLFIKQPSDVLLAAGLQSLGSILAGIFGLFMVKRYFSFKMTVPSYQNIIDALVEGRHVFFSTAAINIYTASNLFILGLLAGITNVGVFGVADKIIRTIQGLLTPISQAIYPHISALVSRSRSAAFQFIRKVLVLFGSVSFVLSLTLYAEAELVVTLFAGPNYQEAVPLVRIMAFIPFVVALSNVFGIQTMLPFNMNAMFSNIIIGAAIFDLIVIFPFISAFSVNGVALASILTESLVTLTMGIVLYRKNLLILDMRQ